MHGPGIYVRTLTASRIKDRYGNQWQYQPRSDAHSKAGCWAILFDLLDQCPLLRAHAESGKVGFGVNHEMRDFKLNRKKKLDLVICTPKSGKARAERSFGSLVALYQVDLTDGEAELLDAMPTIIERPVGTVLLALEAKACMTEHAKARPRLYDELSASQQAIHGDTGTAIAAAFVTVNIADAFASPLRRENQEAGKAAHPHLTEHRQPKAAFEVIQKIAELPRRADKDGRGFDAIGVMMVRCLNDGSPVEAVNGELGAIGVPDILQYDTMISRIARFYTERFSNL